MLRVPRLLETIRDRYKRILDLVPVLSCLPVRTSNATEAVFRYINHHFTDEEIASLHYQYFPEHYL